MRADRYIDAVLDRHSEMVEGDIISIAVELRTLAANAGSRNFISFRASNLAPITLRSIHPCVADSSPQ